MKSRVIQQAQGALLGLAALTLAAAPGFGADQGPYFTFEGGVSLPERTDVRIYDWSDKVKFDPGAHLGFMAGYDFNKWFSAEFETGWYYNTLQDVDASITHVPFLVNAVFRYENRSRLVPYVGGAWAGTAPG